MSKHTNKEHSKALKDALAVLADAMTFRWREDVAYAATYPLADDSVGPPERFESKGASGESMWPYWAEPNTFHLGYSRRGLCAYISWVENGQKEALSSIICEGLTDATSGEKDDDGAPIPRKIDCGMGRVFEQLESWAEAECEIVYDRLPKFDGHDLGKIETAHDAFLSIGCQLALSSDSGDVTFASGGSLAETVTELAGGNDARRDWWVGWTGLAASTAKDGFFDSCIPTINNQSRILAALANLYSTRSAIIEEARTDGLAWIEWATEGLGKTSKGTVDLTPTWKKMQGIGGSIAIGGAWSGTSTTVGAVVTLVGFLGENLIKEVDEAPENKHELKEIVEKLYKEVDDLNTRVTELETDYEDSVTKLQSKLYDVHSFDLELYDLTENSAKGNDRGDGYTTNISGIIGIGQGCFDAAEDYEAQVSALKKTTEADDHLADKDGSPTSGDRALLELRDQLLGFLKTTTGRYYLAYEQVRDAAEAYAAVESDQEKSFNNTTWPDQTGSFDPKKEAKDTDRGSYNPHGYGGHPLSDSEPGEGAEHEYETEETEPNEAVK